MFAAGWAWPGEAQLCTQRDVHSMAHVDIVAIIDLYFPQISYIFFYIAVTIVF